MTDTLPAFRVHFHDGTSMDIQAGCSLVAEARARKERPGHFVERINLLREVRA